MNKLIKFILSIPAKMIAICSFAFIACLFLTIQTNEYVKWNAKLYAYQNWLASDAIKVCKNAEEVCTEETEQTMIGKPFWEKLPVRDACIRRTVGNVICAMNEPVNYSYSNSEMKRVTIDYAVTFAIPFIFVYALKFFAFIKHEGWQRIILTVASVVTIFTAYEYSHAYYSVDEREMLIYSLIAFLSSISFPFILIHFIRWIREGFTNKDEANEKLNELLVDKNSIIYFEISSKFVKSILIVVGAYLMLLAIYFVFPNGMEQIISKAITGGLIAGLYVLFDRWKNRNKKE